ncbi:N-acetyltransferase [Prauserella sp. PE36]|uniref:GNAT family N-acetyltransferase n=1 Tax=Prauserella sp. PE36 TaxID=1504709 RepID=UPI000D8B67FD|nr:GNAT family N-acetyltransferase [Prauserella sp. PE36]PXY24797.1 GCN5 family acetyltransferase [Prauserella coralliicola]RBM22933.1 N-acetyltransferase [Prauserella sp. PE36]
MTGFAALDPLLPETVDPGAGERLTASLPDGREVEGVLYRARYEGWASLWHSRRTWELAPLDAGLGGEAMSALLGALRQRLARESPGPDSACTVTWPSLDTGVVPALLRHGLTPSAVLAVRERAPVPEVRAGGVDVRAATGADAEDLAGLWLDELRYAALVGPAVERPDAARRLLAELRRTLARGEPVWLAEAEGVPVGLAVCAWPAPAPDRIANGLWARVGTVSVAPEARGTGVGRTLMATAHRELLARGAHGTYLFYSPHNALSSVFWHRQGYRPLWTIWEVRPASALS